MLSFTYYLPTVGTTKHLEGIENSKGCTLAGASLKLFLSFFKIGRFTVEETLATQCCYIIFLITFIGFKTLQRFLFYSNFLWGECSTQTQKTLEVFTLQGFLFFVPLQNYAAN